MKKPMVTRTISVTKVNVLCLDVLACEPFNKFVKLSGTFKDNEKLMKAVKEVTETDEIKCVHIVDTSVEEVLYGMDEQKFIENADVLPARKKKEEQ